MVAIRRGISIRTLSPSLFSQLIAHYGIYYGTSIAGLTIAVAIRSLDLLIQSLDPSLSTQLIVRLIVPIEASEIFNWRQHGLKYFEN